MQPEKCSGGQPSLASIQRWFQRIITHPAGIEAGIASDEAQRELAVPASDIERVILPGPSQSSVERLAVYGNAYYLRLLECMREFFPCLTDALGQESFDEFAAGYLQRHPPESYTLHRLADCFVHFLVESQPAQDASWAGFVVDLARLELAIEQVFDGAGPEDNPWPDDPGPVGERAVVPVANWAVEALSEHTRLIPAAGLTLLEFQWPVSSYYSQWKQRKNAQWPALARQCVALVRRDYVVRRHELSPIMYQLLMLLIQGLPVGEAVAQVASSDAGGELHPQDLSRWMAQWVRGQFFSGIANS